ncbi:MAG: alpha/beta hydrolase [Halolamina sp.]
MSDDGVTVLVPGGRDVRGTLDRADGRTPDGDPAADTGAGACVVACPPHPQHRGHRGDARLRAVGDRLTDRGVDCLRFDYGDWDEGYGERADVERAVEWARERYARVGLFGFSFGGCLSLVVAGDAAGDDLAAVSALAPAARIASDLDAVAAMDGVDCPGQVVYGARDDTADWEPVVDRARELEWSPIELAADHFFVGQNEQVADAAGGFLAERLR